MKTEVIVDKEMTIIADVRKWLPSELLFERDMGKYVYQNGAMKIMEVLGRFVSSYQYNAIQRWKGAVAKLRAAERLQSVKVIQRSYRSYVGRRELAHIRQLVQEQKDRELRRQIKLEQMRQRGAITHIASSLLL